jgi:hypothetical protein
MSSVETEALGRLGLGFKPLSSGVASSLFDAGGSDLFSP